MPQLLTLRIARTDGRPIRLWVPVVPVLLLLSPLLVLAAPAGVVVCLFFRINPVRALGTGWRMFCASSGTRVDVVQGRSTAVLVAIR
jgi:hypothetical protein